MTIDEMCRNKVWKDYRVDELPNNAARARLIEIHMDDEDMISRLQISGKRRLYGIRRGNQLYALWWDPEHEIWPSSRN